MASEFVAAAVSLTSLTPEQAQALESTSDFGKTVVAETGSLARYVSRILGTVPEDAVGLIIGDPLHAVRTVVAAKLDAWVTRKLNDRNVTDPQPVSPSLAIPMMRAAYDETRPELQELWASLIANAMDPARMDRVRIRFVETLKQMDPIDARTLQIRHQIGESTGNKLQLISEKLRVENEEILISVQRLQALDCVYVHASLSEFVLTPYGRALLRACES